MKGTGTLLALLVLGRSAIAQPVPADPPTLTDEQLQKLAEQEAQVNKGEVITLSSGTISTSVRGVGQNFLVLPSGGELDVGVKFVTSDPLLGGQPLRFSDLGLFTVSGRWSLLTKLELDGYTTLVPKQPSYTSEKPWQSVGFGIRSPIGQKAAIAIGGAGGHLLDHAGMWTRESLMLEARKPIEDYLSFDVQGGVDGITLTAPNASGAYITEVAVQTAAHFRDPWGHAGGWIGVSYAIPVASHGMDPTTGLAVDPQPRLDLHVGGALSPVPAWDLYVDFAVIDRGDLSNPATRLPILDGGFDQRQIMIGVVRHFEAGDRHHRHDDNDDDRMMLGSR
jgi:hypothetical protein